jgi:hypothetical protein
VSWQLVKATLDEFTELVQFPAIEGKTWNHPVLAGDVLLVRNDQEMASFRLPLARRRCGAISHVQSIRKRPAALRPEAWRQEGGAMMASRTFCDSYSQVVVIVVRPSCSTKVVESNVSPG